MIFPRSLAVKVLVQVLSEHRALDEVLDEFAKAGQVPANALPWLQELSSGTLRWKGRLDGVLDSISVKKKPSGWLRKILLLASYQLIVQDRAPAAAVVSETVSEVKSKEGEAPAKFANACLRKVADHALEWRNLSFPEGGGPQEMASWASLPEWLWTKLVKQQGLEWASAYARASLDRPTLWMRRNPKRSDLWSDQTERQAKGQSERQNDQQDVAGPIQGSWSSDAGGVITAKTGFHEGAFIVQDLSSQLLISEVSAFVQKEGSHKASGLADPLTALDLCAAPGGKSVGLSWSGFQVTATDRTASRVPLLKQTVERVKADIRVVPWEEVNQVAAQDLIWVDAPCSGTGILRRHPDVRWLRRESELPELVSAQRELLSNAWAMVPAGGFLVYSVCSVLQEEGPDALLKTDLEKFEVKRWFLAPQDPPHGDGFWAVLLKKPVP